MIEQNATGWWLPAPASSVVDRYTRAATETLAEVYRHCKGYRVAICAGAHVGVWPKLLVQKFAKVHAFEPDPVNWQCLVLNCADEPRVTLHEKALGEREGKAPWAHSGSNTGKHKISADGGHVVSVTTIDALDLPSCDLISLDVEGYEFPALRGAAATIAEHSPVILFEDIGHGRKYGYAADAVPQWLLQRSYAEVACVFDDRIWARG